MAVDYNKKRKKKKKIITKFGGAGSVFKPGIPAGGYNQDGSNNAGTPDITINGIITPRIMATQFEVDSGNAQAGDSFVFFHSDTPAEIDMFTVINNVKYRVVTTEGLTSIDDVKVYLQLQLRV